MPALLRRCISTFAILFVTLLASQAYLLSFHDAKHMVADAQQKSVSIEQAGCPICIALHAPATAGVIAPPLQSERAPEILGDEIARIATSTFVPGLADARAPPRLT